MRARPAGPAQSSVFHDFARSGPTKEAHRRALNRPDGLLRSVAGQGHGRFLPVTLPRERLTSANRPRPATTAPSPPEGPIKGGVEGPIKGGSRDPWRDPSRGSPAGSGIALERSGGRPELRMAIARSVTVRGPKSASARPGPCTRPRSADALTRREYHPARQAPASRSFVLGRRRRRAGTARWPTGGLRALQLDPGSGRMVPRTRVGRSALRAAAPAGRGRCRAG